MDKIFHCQICERDIKATTGVIAHHGYQRPGDGWQTASCFGARKLPYEISCDAIQPCIDYIKAFISNQETIVKNLMENPPETMTEPRWSMTREPNVYQRPEGFDAEKNLQSYGRGYEYEHRSKVMTHQHSIRNAKHDVVRLEKRLENWKPVTSI